LRPFVESLWAIDRQSAPSPRSAREHVLPTGGMHLVFRLSEEPLRLLDDAGDDAGHTLGHAIVGGARSSYYVRDVSTPSWSVGAMLRPGAARLLFGATAAELAQRHTRLDDLWGRDAAIARERLLEAGAPERQLAVLESLLALRLPVVHGLHPAVAEALDRFHTLDSVHAVVKRSGYSHRHFIDLFRTAVGLTPKVYSRIVRFQKALRRAASGASLATLAVETGYSDQAHFTRDFVEFAGVTPTAYRTIAPPRPSHVALPSRPAR
jgi:AraC-like DNA-binding protein